MTPISMPDKLLAALKDPNRNYTLNGHSSMPRQYAPLISMGMIKLVKKGGDLWGARLVPTTDNLEAVGLACTLLKRRGEGVPERGNEREAAKLLFTDGTYMAPIETIHSVRRRSITLTPSEVSNLWEQAIRGGW